ncbi:hypothetical protein [Coralloluteibacterium stylophorae]|uniref:EF-hand domain-containing protein n=1 Tax=Coralloluteibacterium stylophorae TaxID=1776034 RepID=A0AAP2CDQ0_9GAMM|nr:hypothetical protein [Coralloluteibacterium stylophorae]MBS7458020.1 hypothetical protein [Coralloluteibacterium stylophorae]
MNRTPFRIALTLGLSTMAVAAFAQAPAKGERPAPPPRDVASLEQHARERAAAIDANRDGSITAQEMVAWEDAQRLERAARRLERMGGSDGRISVADFENAQFERIARMDADGDGSIERGEFRRHGRHHRGPHGFDGAPPAPPADDAAR